MDLHQPATDPNQAILERLAALEQRLQQATVASQVTGAEGAGMKIVRGIVDTNGAGSIVEGVGFTITDGGAAGDIVVTFSVPFSDVPTVLPSAVNGFVSLDTTQATVSSAHFQRRNATATADEDGQIMFLAIGPA